MNPEIDAENFKSRNILLFCRSFYRKYRQRELCLINGIMCRCFSFHPTLCSNKVNRSTTSVIFRENIFQHYIKKLSLVAVHLISDEIDAIYRNRRQFRLPKTVRQKWYHFPEILLTLFRRLWSLGVIFSWRRLPYDATKINTKDERDWLLDYSRYSRPATNFLCVNCGNKIICIYNINCLYFLSS